MGLYLAWKRTLVYSSAPFIAKRSILHNMDTYGKKFSKFESTNGSIPRKQENIDIQKSLPQGENTILRELPEPKKTRRITIGEEDFVTINRWAKIGISPV